MKMQKIKKYIGSFIPILLAIFMLIIMGPTEIFFGNYTELGFVFFDFGQWLALAGLFTAVLLAGIAALLPDILRKNVLALFVGGSIAAWIQSMFLNRGLQAIGETAEGYNASSTQKLISAIVWILVIVIFILIANCTRVWNKAFCTIASIFWGIQLVAYVSLFVGADSAALRYTNNELCLDGSEQYTVSSKENIIVLVLDNFSNEWLYEARLSNPAFLDVMKDFTYYNNADCNQYGTYPSLVHLLTGNPINLEQTVNEYTADCWNNNRTNEYFDLLAAKDYKLNVYTNISEILVGNNTLSIAEGKISNVNTASASRTIDYKRLYKTLVKMSCYRYAPDLIKNRFYVANAQYMNIATNPFNVIDYNNYDFYNQLVTRGLTTDDSSNYYVFQHLNGMHEFINNEYCQYDPNITDRNVCLNGVFYMLNEYFSQLQKLNVYDNSTIIVLADHGSKQNGQPIFFIKEKDEHHDSMQETTAPIDYDAFVPTIVANLGEDSSQYGASIYDYEDGQWRERMFVERAYSPDYPLVDSYDGIGKGNDNIYHIYHYTGDMWYLISEYELFHFETQPMIDAFY